MSAMMSVENDTEVRLVAFISGAGSNLRAILQEIEKDSETPIRMLAVISDRPSDGLEYPRSLGISCYECYKEEHQQHFQKIDAICVDINPDIIILAGFLGILPSVFTQKWSGKIINIHPSLLPKFGGRGMYGIHVHNAVLESREKETGCTVHWVIEEVDKGAIIRQESIPVLEHDTPQSLQKRVLKLEHTLYPQVIRELSEHIHEQKKMKERL